MNALVSATGRPLSSRKVRAGVQAHQAALRTLTQALSTFLRLGFFGRIGWLLFGARIFGTPPDVPTLQDVTDEARRRRAAVREEYPEPER